MKKWDTELEICKEKRFGEVSMKSEILSQAHQNSTEFSNLIIWKFPNS